MLRSAFPWRRFELDSAWSPADVERELQRGAPFTGEATVRWDGPPDRRRFRLTRRTARAIVRASALVHPTAFGSHLTVTLRLPVLSFVGLFVVGPLVAALAVLVAVLALLEGEARALLLWFIWIAVWPRALRPFLAEARALEADLRQWVPPPPPPTLGPFR
jgi:hypothetical protein